MEELAAWFLIQLVIPSVRSTITGLLKYGISLLLVYVFFSSFCGTRYLITSMLVLSMPLLISNDKGFSNICAVME